MNRCWFAGRVVAVKRKYRLTVDRREAAALERVLSACRSTDMVFATSRSTPAPARPKPRPPSASGDTVDALRLYDDNGNGRITCREARRHGNATVPSANRRVSTHWLRSRPGGRRHRYRSPSNPRAGTLENGGAIIPH